MLMMFVTLNHCGLSSQLHQSCSDAIHPHNLALPQDVEKTLEQRAVFCNHPP